jgi:hypothetical protein
VAVADAVVADAVVADAVVADAVVADVAVRGSPADAVSAAVAGVSPSAVH